MLRDMCYVFRDKKAFTLIEMIIVVGVIGIALPIFFSIVFVILQQQARVYKLQRVKREGDNILANISSVVRNRAAKIYQDEAMLNPKCFDTVNPSHEGGWGGADFYFKDKDGVRFSYLSDDIYLSSRSANIDGGFEYLNSNKVNIVYFQIKCYRRANYSAPLVSIIFDISDPDDDTIALRYRTKINLRSY